MGLRLGPDKPLAVTLLVQWLVWVGVMWGLGRVGRIRAG